MADSNKVSNSSNPQRVGTSVRYVVGGKSYDASRLQPQTKQATVVTGMENAPRQVSKPVENLSGAVQTGASVSQNVNTQTANPNPSNVYSAKANPYVAFSQNQTENVRDTISRMGATQNVTTGNIQQQANTARASSYTYTTQQAAKEAKILSGQIPKGMPSGRDYTRALGIVAQYEVSTEAEKALHKWKDSAGKNELLNGSKVLLGKAESSLATQDDLGTQGAGGMVAAGMIGSSTFKAAEQASTIGVKGVKVVGNGVYQVYTTADRTVITVGRTVNTMIEKQILPVSKEAISALKFEAQVTGLNNTRIVKGIVNRVDSIKTAFGDVKKTYRSAIKGIKAINHTVDKSVQIIHGVASGRLTVDAAKLSANALKHSKDFLTVKNGIKTGVKQTVGYAVRGTAKGASVATFRGVPAAGRLAKTGIMTAAGAMMSSDDVAVQGLGYAVTGTEIGVKTSVVAGKMAGKSTGYTVKTAIKGGKGLYAGVQFIRNNGLKAAWEAARTKLTQGVAAAGKGLVNLAISGLKIIGKKFIVPLIAICAVVLIMESSVSSLSGVLGIIFGGTFDASNENGEYTEYEMRDYLLDETKGVPSFSRTFKQNLANEMASSASNYDIVRFYSNTNNTNGGNVIEPTLEGVSRVFPTNDEIANMVQPMFNSIIFSKYELSPSESEASKLISELMGDGRVGGKEGIFRIVVDGVDTPIVEYCGQALSDGSGTANAPHSCGRIHALDDCPDAEVGTHTSYTCSDCCKIYYTCNGHKGDLVCGLAEHQHTASCYNFTCKNQSVLHIHTSACYTITCGQTEHTHSDWQSAGSPGCYTTSYHNGELSSDCGNSTEQFKCTGYRYCNGHDVIVYTLNLDGAYALENKYFLKPINNLLNVANPSESQKEELIDLQDNYDIYKEMMKMVAEQYGDLTGADLSNVDFVNGTRKGNDAVITLAKSQLGNVGGQPYWSYYGFQSRVEWCACFVHWCMRNTPSASPSYPDTANNAYCPTIASNFQSMGQWGDRDFTNLVAGDTIFFDWEGDGITDHIGLVIGRDDTYVYTVEGNSNDAVALRKYTIGSSVIYGYGLMNY